MTRNIAAGGAWNGQAVSDASLHGAYPIRVRRPRAARARSAAGARGDQFARLTDREGGTHGMGSSDLAWVTSDDATEVFGLEPAWVREVVRRRERRRERVRRVSLSRHAA